MIIDRVFTPGLAQVAYLVADEASGEVAVIDPRRDVEDYTAWASTRGYRIVAILETHVHADFVSGARELAEVTGAPIYASELGESEFPHTPVNHGDEISVGAVTLKALWTPGHTPEHMSYLAFDPGKGDDPAAFFSGDTVFVGEVGRPDLLGKEQTQVLAEQLYVTITERLTGLEDATMVYPGHTAGSACGRKIGEAPHTTMGAERQFNYAFKARSENEFVDLVLEGMPKPPTYYPVLKHINKAGAPLLATLPEPAALTPDDVAARQAAGALVIDTRSADAFGVGHIPGAIFAALGGSFATWMGWRAPFDRDLILVLDREERLGEALAELHRIGLDRVDGYLAGGMDAWRGANRDVEHLEQIPPKMLAEQLDVPEQDMVVLDVRSNDEWNEDHIPGAMHLYAGDILQGANPGIEPGTPVAVICAAGYRSSVVSSALLQRGYRNVHNVPGGMDAWKDADLPVTS